MQSVKEIYKTGLGPSSSHTMGPAFAAQQFSLENPTADKISVRLCGSLAKTGKGHGTDRALKEILGEKCEVIFDTETENLPHPNTMVFSAFKGDALLNEKTFLSVGGGEITELGADPALKPTVYEHKSFTEIADYCKSRNLRLSDYVFAREDEDFKIFLLDVWKTMCSAIMAGLS